jgi:hypothetical protein
VDSDSNYPLLRKNCCNYNNHNYNNNIHQFQWLSNIRLLSDQFYLNFQTQMMVMLTITREMSGLSSKCVAQNDCESTRKTTEFLKYNQFQDCDAIQCILRREHKRSALYGFKEKSLCNASLFIEWLLLEYKLSDLGNASSLRERERN